MPLSSSTLFSQTGNISGKEAQCGLPNAASMDNAYRNIEPICAIKYCSIGHYKYIFAKRTYTTVLGARKPTALLSSTCMGISTASTSERL